MALAPIVLFIYDRPEHSRQTVESLQENELANQSKLFVFSDGAKNERVVKNVEKVREYVRSINGFKQVTVIEREKNYGLAANIIDGVSKIVNEYGKVIVLEDDLVSSPYFLRFMNDGLETYKHEEQVASIHGYVYPLKNSSTLPESFFIKGADCWGWATWKRAWEVFESDGQSLLNELQEQNLFNEFDQYFATSLVEMLRDQINGKNNSWAIRWIASTFLRNMYTLYPRQSLIKNIGLDASGTHCGINDDFDVILHDEKIVVEKQKVLESKEALDEFKNYFKKIAPSFYRSLMNKLKRTLF